MIFVYNSIFSLEGRTQIEQYRRKAAILELDRISNMWMLVRGPQRGMLSSRDCQSSHLVEPYFQGTGQEPLTNFISRPDDLSRPPAGRQMSDPRCQLPDCQLMPHRSLIKVEEPTFTFIRSTSLSISFLYFSARPVLLLSPISSLCSLSIPSSKSLSSNKIPPPPGVRKPFGISSTALLLILADEAFKRRSKRSSLESGYTDPRLALLLLWNRATASCTWKEWR